MPLNANSLRNRITHMRAIEITLAVFSALFALSIVLSNHIVINGGTYDGLADENYISPYGILDLALFIALFAVTFLIAAILYTQWAKAPGRTKPLNIDKLHIKPLALCASAIAVLHLPYLLAYYPGFIFSDSLSSISQALGLMNYSNHHPVTYTLIVQACIELAHSLGFSTTTGCAIYSLLQTILMALSYATIIQWIMQRLSLGGVWRVLLVTLFGFTPYIATYSIAMWKDPLFSAALVVASILIADLVLTNGKIIRESKLWPPVFIICCVAIALLRSNGALVDALLCAALAIYAFTIAAENRWLSVFACLVPASAIAINLLLTGPIYNALNVTPNEKVEGLGIPLAQMARVVTYEGDMSDSDADYMNELLPLEEYKYVYAPTCIDPLKWNSKFNSAPLEDDFYEHWLSMLVKNPKFCFEAWELQTFGYWAVNHPVVIFHTGNISGGVPRTAYDPRELESYGITPHNFLGATDQSLPPYENQSIPISWITWALIFLCLILPLSSNSKWLIPLLPSVALLVSLLIASPIWYWERYAAATQFLIPFYIALILVIKRTNLAKPQQQGF